MSVVGKVLGALGANPGIRKNTDQNVVARYAFNKEGLDDTSLSLGKSGFESVKDEIEQLLVNLESELATPFSVTQKAAGVQAAMIAMNPTEWSKSLKRSFESAIQAGEGVVNTNLEGFGMDALNGVDVLNSFNQEAFDGQALSTVYYATIALSVAVSKQDDFADAFFPLITMNAADAFYEIKLDVDSITQDYRHITPRTTGGEVRSRKVPLLKNLTNNKLLGENRLRIKPFIDNDTEDALIKDAKFGVTVGEETYDSAPYAMGVMVDTFAVCNTKGEAAKGSIPDMTDALDRTINLSNVYLQFEDSASTKGYVRLNLANAPLTAFQIPAEGSNKELKLAFSGEFVLNSKETKCAFGKTAESMFGTALAGGTEYEVTVELQVNGTANTAHGNIKLTASGLDLISLKNVTDGTVITNRKDATFIQFATQLKKVVATGYDLDLAVTNSNFRKRGLYLTNESFRYRENCEYRSGVNIAMPIYNSMGQDNDALAATVEKQSLAITSMMSTNAVMVLDDFVNYLNDRKTAKALADIKVKTGSLHFVEPYYVKDEIKLQDIVDSLRSTERREDIANAIINKIIDAATIMAIDSNYKLVFEKFNSGMKPTVVIGTDPYTASYLGKQLQPAANATTASNVFTLTQDLNAVIVSSLNPLMKDRMIISFTVIDDANRNTVPNLLSFGHCLYTPSINREVQVSRGGATIKELFVEPRFTYMPSLPVVTEFRVSGISDAIKKNIRHQKIIP